MITVLVKNVKDESLKVDFFDANVQVNINMPDYEAASLNFNLTHKIVPEQSSYKLMPSKVPICAKIISACSNYLIPDRN